MEFIAALYNEERQVMDLLAHIYPHVSKINLVDDGSVDDTVALIQSYPDPDNKIRLKVIEHTGLPETVKSYAVEMAGDGWIAMLDADERFTSSTLREMVEFVDSPKSKRYSHCWFTLAEYMDGVMSRTFEKCRLFRKGAIEFAQAIHSPDVLIGQGTSPYNWVVEHRKTKEKQIQRETEHLLTYKKLLAEGKINQLGYQSMISAHYFVKPHG